MSNRHAEHDAALPPSVGLPDVGLYIDDERSIAAVSRPSAANPSLHVASLHSTVLYVHADGSVSLGGTDDLDAAEFTDYVGAEVDSGFEPGDLVAMTLRCLLAEVAHSVGTDMSFMAAAATFPASWTAERVSDVRIAMNRHGLDHVALVSETDALAAWANTVQATWAGADTGIAAARGAASIASEYPVDAVTEEIRLARPAPPVWARTPILAAVALASILALGGGVAALVLQDSTTPAIPAIEGAPAAAPRTTATSPTSVIPFPTVVPIIEPAVPAPSSLDAGPPTATDVAVDGTTENLPRTRPVSDTTAPSGAEDAAEDRGGDTSPSDDSPDDETSSGETSATETPSGPTGEETPDGESGSDDDGGEESPSGSNGSTDSESGA